MADTKSLETIATEAADKLVRAIESYGPKATDLALATGQIAAAQELVLSVAGTGAGLGLLYAAYRLGKLAYEKFDEWEERTIPIWIAALLALLSGAIATPVNMAGVLNIFAWVGLSRPEIYLAAKLLKL